jgi:hypothetical protein
MAKINTDGAAVTEAPISAPATPASKSPSAALFADLDSKDEYLNILFYGREGSGKTTAAVTLANLGQGDVLVVNAEGGLKRNTLKRLGIDTSRIKIWPPQGESITHKGLDELHRALKADLAKNPNSWAGVVFDSATEIVPALVDQVATDRIDKASKRGVNIDAVDQFFTDRSDYGTMSKMFRDILRKFRDLPTHFIITALERRDVDDDTGKVTYGPAVTPGVQADLLGFVDLVLACSAADAEENKPFRALTKSAGKYRGKDRLGVLPRVLVNPTIPRILAYESGELTEENDSMQRELTRPAENN